MAQCASTRLRGDDSAGSRGQQRRRAAAAAALVALVVALLYLAISAIFRWYILLTSVILLGVAVVAVWFILSRRGLARAVAGVVAAVALVTFVGVVLATESLIVLTVGLGLAAVSIVAASYALSPVSAAVDNNKRAPRAHHPVLLMNLRSGGGKAERFALADLCRERGIEPVILNPGDDLRQLAEDAVSRGADLLGMAGGDGSLALVASIASQHGIPFVVIPAGTRKPLRARSRPRPRRCPWGVEGVRGRCRHRNRSCGGQRKRVRQQRFDGVYARIVQSADYRNAKVQTAATMLPNLLGPEATPLDLRFTLPSGQEAAGPQLLLVSDNPYQLAQLRGGGTRECLDGGALGIVYVRVESAADVERLAAFEVAGQVQRSPA
jgi:Diacylglycerol kinase catalytic domain